MFRAHYKTNKQKKTHEQLLLEEHKNKYDQDTERKKPVKDIFVKASLMRCRVFLLPLSEKALSPGVFCFFFYLKEGM